MLEWNLALCQDFTAKWKRRDVKNHKPVFQP